MGEVEFKEFLAKEMDKFSVRMQEDIKLLTDSITRTGGEDIIECTKLVFEEIDEDYLDVIDTIGEEFDKHFTPEKDADLFEAVKKMLEENADKINEMKYDIGNSFVEIADEALEGAE